jgi:hypothetical protein
MVEIHNFVYWEWLQAQIQNREKITFNMYFKEKKNVKDT